ncbi:endonuclease [Sinorhizobium meliloti]|uniref:endonuclease n=1 Tax=Rhizobium meliloti TaxID=382 RepID=UPI000FD3F76E|nr:endonuclease [Sinorhizobium meliloti]RVI09473.1 endonuclease [Sinorhizobium meliloti]RVN83159.1 endonuclease [Sinorhizobium meliloti]RVO04610.1 endonuclease [Sinorhizobium meliloti]
MRRVDRSQSTEPSILHKTDKAGKTELDRIIAHMNGPDAAKTFEFARYKESAVKLELERLFHGKCAYCESFYGSTQPVDVEHYRPKGEVEGVPGHRGYYWLAMDWNNLLPSCIDCNRRREQKAPSALVGSIVKLLSSGEFDRTRKMSLGKSSAFPLATETGRALAPGDNLLGEQRLLLDPTRDDPREHLTFLIDRDNLIGLVLPKLTTPAAPALGQPPNGQPEDLVALAAQAGVSPMGLVSIQVYGLNRLSLVQARKVLRDLEFVLELSIGLAEIVEDIDSETARKTAQLGGAAAAQAQQLRDDIAFNAKIKSRIEGFKRDTLAQLKRMADPKEPYSELVRAWISRYLS